MHGVFIRNMGSELSRSGTSVTKSVTSGAAVSFAASDFPVATEDQSQYRYVLVQVQDQPVRVGYNGETPTTGSGQRRQAGDDAVFARETFLGMKFIAESSTAKIWALPCNLG